MARAAEKTLKSDLRPRGNSDLVAGLEEIKISRPVQRRSFLSSDLMARANSDLVAGLKGIQI